MFDSEFLSSLPKVVANIASHGYQDSVNVLSRSMRGYPVFMNVKIAPTWSFGNNDAINIQCDFSTSEPCDVADKEEAFNICEVVKKKLTEAIYHDVYNALEVLKYRVSTLKCEGDSKDRQIEITNDILRLQRLLVGDLTNELDMFNNKESSYDTMREYERRLWK